MMVAEYTRHPQSTVQLSWRGFSTLWTGAHPAVSRCNIPCDRKVTECSRVGESEGKAWTRERQGKRETEAARKRVRW